MQIKESTDSKQALRLDHHGLVAATCHELGIANKINARLGSPAPDRIVQTGEAVVAMILNGLGFTQHRLYLTPQFFQDKPVSWLLGADIEAHHLNDDALGKALDEIVAYDPTQLFAEVAFEVADEQGLLGHRGHLDSTSFYLHGAYEGEDQAIEVKHGYSKDHRPDLKQVMLSMVMTGAAQLPLWIEPQSGNSSDKTRFPQTIEAVHRFRTELADADSWHWVADSALYTQSGLLKQNTYQWITRVPETIQEAQTLVAQPGDQWTWHDLGNGYSYTAHTSHYGGIQQRWLLIHSNQAWQREQQTFERQLAKQARSLEKALRHLKRQTFACPTDAQMALDALQAKFPYWSIQSDIEPIERYSGRGRPKQGSQKHVVGYQVTGDYERHEAAINQVLISKGRFILATNQLDTQRLPDHVIFEHYKEQQGVERGFRFLKDPWFMMNAFYVKNTSRIQGLMVVMALCLLVYNFAQHKLRQQLETQQQTLPNQKNQPVQNPTMRWIFELLAGITLIVHPPPTPESPPQGVVMGLTDVHRNIMRLMGNDYCKIYGISMEGGGM